MNFDIYQKERDSENIFAIRAKIFTKSKISFRMGNGNIYNNWWLFLQIFDNYSYTYSYIHEWGIITL